MTTKFKVGDRVRTTTDSDSPNNNSYQAKGYEFTIAQVFHGDHVWYREHINVFRGVRETDLELVSPQTPAQKLGYKVGDTVVATVNYGTYCEKGDLLKFIKDDGIQSPLFQALKSREQFYRNLSFVGPLKNDVDFGHAEIANKAVEEINNKTITQKIMDTLRQIPATLKRVLSPELSSQYRAEFINGDLKLTSKGKEALIDILAIKFEKELAEAADEIIKEVEKSTTK